MGEPLRLRPWEIARLTDRQVLNLYLHPRDEQGRVVPKVRTDRLDAEEALAAALDMAQTLGVPKEAVLAAWERNVGHRSDP